MLQRSIRKSVTIYDIASELKVAPSTVSRALQDHYSIGKNTKKRIRALAHEMGYRPNTLAAAMGKTRLTIGVIVSQVNLPRISSMICGIQQEANSSGFNVIIAQSHNCYNTELTLANSLREARVSGMVVSLSKEALSTDHFKEFTENNIPVVFLDSKVNDISMQAVIVDYFEASRKATLHLLDQGCRRIAFVGDTGNGNAFSEKLRGYKDALGTRNIIIDENLIIDNKVMNVEQGYSCARRLLDHIHPSDGVFADDDSVAIGIIQFARKRGISIPQELAVVGFNNDPESLVIDPPLSTMAYPSIQMGSLAAREIMDQSNRGELVAKTIALNAELIVRASSKGARINS